MAENTAIEWATHTFNPWRGCTKVSAGCANCYAETLSHRNPGTLGVWGPNGTRVVAAESAWKEPLKWNRLAKAAGERHRVFCASLADVFEDWTGPMVDSRGVNLSRVDGACEVVTTMQDVRNRLFALIDATPNLDWLLLTKRPENFSRMLPDYTQITPGMRVTYRGWSVARPNVWLGTSVENQQAADERIHRLLAVPARVHFLSMEPLLGPVDLEGWLGDSILSSDEKGSDIYSPGITWVIVGGESGPNARPCHPDWVRSLRDQCNAEGVPFFFKQWGEWGISGQCPGGGVGLSVKRSVWVDMGGRIIDTPVKQYAAWANAILIGKSASGRTLDGRTWDELPEVRS